MVEIYAEEPNAGVTYVTKAKETEVKYSYLFLHGLGESKDKYLAHMRNGKFPLLDNFRYILVNAPFRFNTRSN